MGGREPIRNVELLMAKQKYLKRFQQLLIDLQGWSINGHFKQTVQRFRGCLKPNEAQGESRLPFYSQKPTSPKKDKDACVLHVLSFAIQTYWYLCEGDLSAEVSLDTSLTELEGYAKDGRDAHEITGEFPEFYLKEK